MPNAMAHHPDERLLLVTSLFDIGVVKTEQTRVRLGDMFDVAPFYVSFREISKYPEVMKRLVRLAANEITDRRIDFDLIASTSESADDLVRELSAYLGTPFVQLKKGGVIEGRYQIGQKALLFNDVLVSGNQQIALLKRIRSQGLNTTGQSDLLVMVNRSMMKNGWVSHAAPLRLHYSFTVSELFRQCLALNCVMVPSHKLERAIQYIEQRNLA